jgi:hypothetical protein
MKTRLSDARRVAFRNDLYYYFESLAREADHSVSRSRRDEALI